MAVSERNVEMVCQMLLAWARGDRGPARAAFDSDVVLIAPIADAPVMFGIAQMETALEGWRRTWDDWRMEIEETFDAGDDVVVLVRQWGTGKESGAQVSWLNAGVYTVRNSKIVRVEFFPKREEALEAAGLAH